MRSFSLSLSMFLCTAILTVPVLADDSCVPMVRTIKQQQVGITRVMSSLGGKVVKFERATEKLLRHKTDAVKMLFASQLEVDRAGFEASAIMEAIIEIDKSIAYAIFRRTQQEQVAADVRAQLEALGCATLPDSDPKCRRLNLMLARAQSKIQKFTRQIELLSSRKARKQSELNAAMATFNQRQEAFDRMLEKLSNGDADKKSQLLSELAEIVSAVNSNRQEVTTTLSDIVSRTNALEQSIEDLSICLGNFGEL